MIEINTTGKSWEFVTEAILNAAWTYFDIKYPKIILDFIDDNTIDVIINNNDQQIIRLIDEVDYPLDDELTDFYEIYIDKLINKIDCSNNVVSLTETTDKNYKSTLNIFKK